MEIIIVESGDFGPMTKPKNHIFMSVVKSDCLIKARNVRQVYIGGIANVAIATATPNQHMFLNRSSQNNTCIQNKAQYNIEYCI